MILNWVGAPGWHKKPHEAQIFTGLSNFCPLNHSFPFFVALSHLPGWLLWLLFFGHHCQVLLVGIKGDVKSVGASWEQGQELWDVWLKPSLGSIRDLFVLAAGNPSWDDQWCATFPVSEMNR